VAVCQNRIAEKSFLRDNGLPHGPFAVIHVADIAAAPASLYPAILKVARFGYDGKGQARVANAAEACTPSTPSRASPACSSRC
jgi:5-(carboxyamino)imidazole ribonucleotide synthase